MARIVTETMEKCGQCGRPVYERFYGVDGKARCGKCHLKFMGEKG